MVMDFETLSMFMSVSCAMSLLKYLKPKDGLPDPKRPLLQSVPSPAIAAVKEEVNKVESGGKKHGPYRQYTPEECSAIGKYMNAHGIVAAACYFTGRFG